jgi:hypothetical protein
MRRCGGLSWIEAERSGTELSNEGAAPREGGQEAREEGPGDCTYV